MPTQPDIFPALALKKTKDPALVGLFTKLRDLAAAYAKLRDQYLEGIVLHREIREGKPFRFTKNQQITIQELDKDAERASFELGAYVQNMDDVGLLVSALVGERQQLVLDQMLLIANHPDDMALARQIIEHRRTAIELIESYISKYNKRDEVEAAVRRLSPKPKN